MHDAHRLPDLAIASPCTADWNTMTGDAKRRFCQQCRLHVHDLSAMTSAEAVAVLEQAGEGRVCVRFYRRADGRVLTQDCPVGLRERLRRVRRRAAAVAAAVYGAFLTLAGCTPEKRAIADPAPPEMPARQLQGEVSMPERALMGDVAVPAVMGRIAAPQPPVEPGQPQSSPK